MKSVATINTHFPSVEDDLEYLSGGSLRDYDIIVFNPKFPYQDRIQFSGGGSSVSIMGTERIRAAISHWNAEMRDALALGKTIFVLLNKHEIDSMAVSCSTVKGSRNYTTTQIDNYSAIPLNIKARNSTGRHIVVADSRFKDLFALIKDISQYHVLLESFSGTKIFSTKDGSAIGGLKQIESMPGTIVLLPYFDFVHLDPDKEEWSSKTMNLSRNVVTQLISIDSFLRSKESGTPAPEWIVRENKPAKLESISRTINSIDAEITILEARKQEQLTIHRDIIDHSFLLYENGQNLERAIEKALKMMGYKVENIRIGDFEIDHVITSPEGVRMIGESEGKDNSAIDISKFRQLESNINEDFDRESIETPAKGVLFGNGFRLVEPSKRGIQFTQKCLTNARRLGTALVRTMDLYRVALYLIDKPDDEIFKAACREALERTVGDIVEFPTPPRNGDYSTP